MSGNVNFIIERVLDLVIIKPGMWHSKNGFMAALQISSDGENRGGCL